MEKREEIMPLLMVLLVFGLLTTGQSTASFQSCYLGCFLLCVIVPGNSAFNCSINCLKECIFPGSVVAGEKNTHFFCNLGCATSLCTNLSSEEKPGEGEVGSCVDSCSNTCAKKN